MKLNKYQRKFIDILTDLDPLDLPGMISIAKQFREACKIVRREELKRYMLKKKLIKEGVLLK